VIDRNDPRIARLNIPEWYWDFVAPRPMSLDEFAEWNRAVSEKMTAEQRMFFSCRPVDVPFEIE
jgi:hypothetical protein